MKTVAELMSRELETAPIGWSVLQVVALMRRRRVGSVLITDNNEIVGIFTERDLLTKVDLTRPVSPQTTPIREVMSGDLTTIEAQQSFLSAVRCMRRRHVRHLPVTENGRIAGMISFRDIAEYYEEHIEQAVEGPPT